MSFYAGKNASIGDGTHNLTASDWTLELHTDIIDTTNFTSQAYQENIAGVFRATISASGPYNGGIGANTVVVLGATTSFSLAVGGAGPTFTTTCRVERIVIKTSVRGAAEFDFSAQSTGTWSITP